MMVTTERENLKKLLGLELETQDQLATGIRNHRLRALVEGKVGEDRVKPTNDLLKQLVGPADAFEKVQGTLGKLRSVLASSKPGERHSRVCRSMRRRATT